MSDSSDHVVHLEKKSLKRSLGAKELFSVGYGDVGSSIYYALGVTALYALGATPIAFALAGFVFICTALTYAEMASTFPEPGGSATFSRYAFNDLISFIAGWGLLLDYIVTIAISAFAIPPYVKYIIPYSSSVISHTVATCLIIGILYLVNLVGVKHSGRLSLVLAVITIISQAFVILAALFLLLNLPHVISQLKINVPGAAWSPSWGDFIKGTAMAMVAYTGIESIAQLAAETKKPSIAIPKAIKWTVLTLVILYIGISIVGLSVISPQALGTTYVDDPVAGIVAQFPFGGKWLAPWFGLIAAIILLIAANAGLIGCSRLAFSMGEYYQVPHIFYRLHPRFRTPYISLGAFTLVAMIIVILSQGQMLFLADLYNFGAQIAFFSAHMSLIVLRCKKPSLTRPYKAPFNIPIGKGRSIPLTALIGTLATFSVWLVVVITKPDGRNLGLIWIGFGLLMYFLYRKKKQISPTGQLSIEKIKIPEYHPMHLKHILVTARMLGNTDALQTACQLAKSYNCKITAVHVIEIPASLPMHASMIKREEIGDAALKRAEAVAREYDLSIDLKLVRSRTIEGALLELLSHGEYDMVVVGTKKHELRTKEHFAVEVEKLLIDAPCRVIFCKS
ncbi:MAG: amino acid permease [Chlamydiae bacterium CG10_big_fil_rev_8_21_14_0_10_42_34]|nr:MAG: amino acid permease [Chlamydiae bacterium CG10_big_fil_rev_8_21_14_0_10_42_34]